MSAHIVSASSAERPASVLIRDAEVAGRRADVWLSDERILAIRPVDQPTADATAGVQIIDACAGALLPGLHDHHMHLLGLAAARQSVACGPPSVRDDAGLRARLQTAAAQTDRSWLRGVGYHQSVAGDIDRHWLDQVVSERPVRIQHRSGRLWILNSAALACLSTSRDSPLERIGGVLTGRLYDADIWLRHQLASQYPWLADTCRELATLGITGLTDASVSNDLALFEHLCAQTRADNVPQRLHVMGGGALSGIPDGLRATVGAFKIHLHEHALPELSETAWAVAAAHDAGRVAAFHCVTQAELVFALGVLDESGPLAGDRIEHAATVSPELLQVVADRELVIVTQPHFILERGEQYYRDIARLEHPWLYRCASWYRSDVALAAGSDAPYGNSSPWIAMQAAVDRRNADGRSLGPDEALSPEQALALYLSSPEAPGRDFRSVAVGSIADLCLLDRSWNAARQNLAAVRVKATVCRGRLVSSA